MKFINYETYNAFRRPEWRFERVLSLCERLPSPGRCTVRDDIYVRTARNFLLRFRAREKPERKALFYEYPGLYYAYEWHEATDTKTAFTVQARLLARQTPAEIAAETNLLPEGVEWYEKLFFNVTDRINSADWIVNQVIMPAILRNLGLRELGEDDGDMGNMHKVITKTRFTPVEPIAIQFYDASLKLFAYYAGPLMVDVMLAGFQKGKFVKRYEDISLYLDEHAIQSIKRRSAQAIGLFEVNRYNVMELFNTHARIMEMERNVDTDMATKTDFEKQVGGMLEELPSKWVKGAPDESDTGALVRYDSQDAELRDEELQQVAAGEYVGSLEGMDMLKMPELRPHEPPPKPQKAAE